MAKTSTKYRNVKRMALVAKYAEKRKALKKIMASPATTEEDFYKAQRALARLPRDSSAVRVRNRCQITGRPRANIRKFGICRNKFRELALFGKIPGITKSSW
jgi:small subunit ribosomal protein S14